MTSGGSRAPGRCAGKPVHPPPGRSAEEAGAGLAGSFASR